MTPTSRPTLLLTGSSGVIGASLLTALTGRYEVISLVHRHRPHQAAVCVQADLTADGLGLDAVRYRELAATIDVIVHCAALTAFAPPDLRAFDDINAEGTRRVLDLAEAAKAPVVLLSSAAAAFDVPGDDLTAHSMRAYSLSKRRAEQLAAVCAQPVAVVRPALLFAALDAPGPPRHQFPHTLLTALLAGRTNGLPLHRDHWCDILPMETLTAYLTALTGALLTGDTGAPGLHWTTAGAARVSAADMEEACLQILNDAGRQPPKPLLADPATFPPRTHGMARMAQLGFQPPAQPALPSDLHRLLPTQPTRSDVLRALSQGARRCAPWAQ
ncbi:SDR family oxidoreductase [Streptomyces hundungensis]|uniref:SDR family oxidoreductase n=1 Tax=Streptomyces hundungensis TaxID=1077946 RepID=UPI0033D934A4